GVPAYIDGYVIEIPQGTFYVAEACAGLRFLIASIAFGFLYALLMFRSPVRRGVFVLASMTVPIFANGLRAIGIVYLGYLLGSAQAAAADHILYGWLFFSLVILLLIALGLPFRQDDMPGEAEPQPGMKDSRRQPRQWGGMAAAVLAVIVLSALAPAAVAVLMSTSTPPAFALKLIPVGSGCDVTPGSAADNGGTERVVCGDVAMDVTWRIFSPRVTAGPVMAARHRLTMPTETESHAEDWLGTPDRTRSPWRIMSSSDPAYMMAVSVWMDGVAVRPGLPMRARMAMDSLLGASHAPIIVAVTPAVNWAAQPAGISADLRHRLTTFLLDHPDLLSTVGTLSRLPR
ncbi:MAG TPA: archaeosortase/exosortase family protein, partial [Rhodopila sp.]|nr:archaeosortase/exosortase family protein [Rhodopila sp.]